MVVRQTPPATRCPTDASGTFSRTGEVGMEIAGAVVGPIARAIFWIGVALIVGAAAVHYYDLGKTGISVVAVIFFPLTYVIYPWTHSALGVHLWLVFVVASVCYSISALLGVEPVG
jgi:hypothetical protein